MRHLITFAQRWPYTIAACLLLAALTVWLVLTRQPWTHWLLAAAYLAACAWRGISRPSGWTQARSLPCPPQCHIRVAHRHDPLSAWGIRPR